MQKNIHVNVFAKAGILMITLSLKPSMANKSDLAFTVWFLINFSHARKIRKAQIEQKRKKLRDLHWKRVSNRQQE